MTPQGDKPSGFFVTGTDTGVGKTVIAGLIAACAVGRGLNVSVFKPVETGLHEAHGLSDCDFLKAAASSQQTVDEISPYRLSLAASPHLAAEVEAVRIEPALIVERARSLLDASEMLICEGIGGLLAPLTESYTVRDLALDLQMPLVVVARPGLGTINHTLLTLEAAEAAGLKVRTVVMTPWPEVPDEIARSNRKTVERIRGIKVVCIPRLPKEVLDRPSPENLRQWSSNPEFESLLFE